MLGIHNPSPLLVLVPLCLQLLKLLLVHPSLLSLNSERISLALRWEKLSHIQVFELHTYWISDQAVYYKCCLPVSNQDRLYAVFGGIIVPTTRHVSFGMDNVL